MAPAQIEALLLSLLVEGLTALVLARWVFTTWSLRPGLSLLVAMASTAVTHPLGWWALYTGLAHLNSWLAWGTVELGVVALEAVAYSLVAGLPRGRALGISLTVNSASAGLGLALL